ncbi:hypothetical protein NKG60_01870 [Mesorhizobium sp. M1428]|uniref:hypothetical protein n=1 Tax=Mesorhizobium sp. M1428 TaxID=2957102 RepID=UPI003339A8E5
MNRLAWEKKQELQMSEDGRSTRTIVVDGVPLPDLLDETMIRGVVHGLYDEIHRDDLLGPIFHDQIEPDRGHSILRRCATSGLRRYFERPDMKAGHCHHIWP